MSDVPFHDRRACAAPAEKPKIIKIISGECVVTDDPNIMLETILGSCVAACIRDPMLCVGGMNHFLLPSTSQETDQNSGDALRYGAFAMERLINEILKRGGVKSRLEVKLFGGGNVIKSGMMIGDKNAQFVRRFMAAEGLTIAGEDLGDSCPRRVHYYPGTGKVMLRRLQRKDDFDIADTERTFMKQVSAAPIEGSIELFD